MPAHVAIPVQYIYNTPPHLAVGFIVRSALRPHAPPSGPSQPFLHLPAYAGQPLHRFASSSRRIPLQWPTKPPLQRIIRFARSLSTQSLGFRACGFGAHTETLHGLRFRVYGVGFSRVLGIPGIDYDLRLQTETAYKRLGP